MCLFRIRTFVLCRVGGIVGFGLAGSGCMVANRSRVGVGFMGRVLGFFFCCVFIDGEIFVS